MAKLENYRGTIQIIDGLNTFGEDYPLMDAHYVQTGEDGKRLDTELEEMKQNILDLGSTSAQVHDIITLARAYLTSEHGLEGYDTITKIEIYYNKRPAKLYFSLDDVFSSADLYTIPADAIYDKSCTVQLATDRLLNYYIKVEDENGSTQTIALTADNEYFYPSHCGVLLNRIQTQFEEIKKTGTYNPDTVKFALPKWAELFDFEEKPFVNEPNNLYTFEQFYTLFHSLCGVDYASQAVFQGVRTDIAVGETVSAKYDTEMVKMVEIDCVEGDVFEIKANGHSNQRLWCFVDANGVKLSGSTGNLVDLNRYETPVTVTAPANAVKIIVQFYWDGYPDIYVKKMNEGLVETVMDTAYLAESGDEIPSNISEITNGGMYMYHLAPPQMNNNSEGSFTTKHKTLKVLLVSGIHGSEKKSIWDHYYLLKALVEGTPESRALTILRNFCDLYVIPLATPSAIQNNTYTNANKVNVNRDFAVSDWVGTSGSASEPNSQYETRCLSWWVDQIKPHCMIDHHTSSGDDRTEGGRFIQWGSSPLEAVACLIEENLIDITTYVKRRYPDKFAGYNHIFGHTENVEHSKGAGTLPKYCHDRGIISACYEVVMHLYWNGGYIFGYAEEDETAISTINYHGYINFLMKFIQLSVKIIDKC